MLLCADLLLCALAMLFAFRQQQPLRAEEMTLCIAAVIMGASLSYASCFLGQWFSKAKI